MKNLMELSDEQLIKLYMDADNNALSTLITRHKQKIFTSIYFLIKDKYIAEDIFQDVFIRIIDKIKAGQYNEKGKFIQWAMCIAHNMSIDQFRNLKRNPTIVTSDDRDIFDELNFSESGIDQKIVNEESHVKVRKMLDLLPEEQREVIILRHYANLSFKEVADLTKCSLNTALGRMRYGLINLRKMARESELA